MPRLNNQRYIQRHLLLRRMWLMREGRFSLLRPTQQWDIHDYYKPSRELTEAELVAHRRKISCERPTLPARASKAFKVLVGPSHGMRTGGTVHVSPGGRRIRVQAIVQPEPNTVQLARAFLSLAEELAARERDDSSINPL